MDAAQAVLFMRKEMTQAGPGTQKLQEAAMAIEEGITRAISLLGVRDGDDL